MYLKIVLFKSFQMSQPGMFKNMLMHEVIAKTVALKNRFRDPYYQ